MIDTESPYDKYIKDYNRRKNHKNRGKDEHLISKYENDPKKDKEKYRSVYKTKNFDRKHAMAPYEKREVDSRFVYIEVIQ